MALGSRRGRGKRAPLSEQTPLTRAEKYRALRRREVTLSKTPGEVQ